MKKSVNFPYAKYKRQFYPIIKIEVTGPAGSLETQAYVDSGASVSIFLSKFADALGVDLTKGRPTYIMVGDGGFIPVYLHRLPVKIGPFTFRPTIGFSSYLGADFNLIGQNTVTHRLPHLTSTKRKVIFV